ncbi:MAG: PEP-CTERM sorting domain-containing protein [Gammaproteobacteria bacterium]|nr:PEP-CTERM sorting domain-containing protein [Gammaproteobacteria bacterium]
MKNLNKLMTGASIAAALFAGSASAGVLNGGYSIQVAQIFEYASVDSNGNGVIDVVGEQLGGIGNIQSITSSSGDILWTTGTGGQELTFSFDGYTAGVIQPAGFGQYNIAFYGGSVKFYLDGAQNFNAAGGPLGGAIGTATDGAFFMELLGGSGIVAAGFDPLLGVGGTTLLSTLNGLTSPFTGSGFGYLDVNLANLGLAGDFYDRNGMIGANGEERDFLLESSFNATEGQNAGWPVGGTASLTGIPEPGTLALMGLGVLAMGFASRKRAK